MLLNRYARVWLCGFAIAGVGTIIGVVPWPLTAALTLPLLTRSTRRLLWTLHPRSLSDRQLAHAWLAKPACPSRVGWP
jgi:hypothetical protein